MRLHISQRRKKERDVPPKSRNANSPKKKKPLFMKGEATSPPKKEKKSEALKSVAGGPKEPFVSPKRESDSRKKKKKAGTARVRLPDGGRRRDITHTTTPRQIPKAPPRDQRTIPYFKTEGKEISLSTKKTVATAKNKGYNFQKKKGPLSMRKKDPEDPSSKEGNLPSTSQRRKIKKGKGYAPPQKNLRTQNPRRFFPAGQGMRSLRAPSLKKKKTHLRERTLWKFQGFWAGGKNRKQTQVHSSSRRQKHKKTHFGRHKSTKIKRRTEKGGYRKKRNTVE